jgi:hypothetical protein
MLHRKLGHADVGAVGFYRYLAHWDTNLSRQTGPAEERAGQVAQVRVN